MYAPSLRILAHPREAAYYHTPDRASDLTLFDFRIGLAAPAHGYSYLKATMGSTLDARRAGTKLAKVAITVRKIAAAVSVSGS